MSLRFHENIIGFYVMFLFQSKVLCGRDCVSNWISSFTFYYLQVYRNFFLLFKPTVFTLPFFVRTDRSQWLISDDCSGGGFGTVHGWKQKRITDDGYHFPNHETMHLTHSLFGFFTKQSKRATRASKRVFEACKSRKARGTLLSADFLRFSRKMTLSYNEEFPHWVS